MTTEADNRTTHMTWRMVQRGIGNEQIALIREFGDWNARGDRLTLNRDGCAKAEETLREEIRALIRKPHRAGGCS